MDYDFLVNTYRTERLKVLSVWAMFHDEDMERRPNAADGRGRSVREHMVHQCVSEELWFRTILGIDVGAPPLPQDETRISFLERYAEDSGKRAAGLALQPASWWQEDVPFFEISGCRAWVMVRRIAHTAHHRGQQTALLRMLNRAIHSTYGPTADTGGLPKNGAPTVYAYPDETSLITGERDGGRKAPLPRPGMQPVTERPVKQP